MNLVSMILGLPLAPLRGVVAVSKIIQTQADQELNDPSRLRREIEETEAAVEAGELSEEEAERKQQEAIESTVAAPTATETSEPDENHAAE